MLLIVLVKVHPFLALIAGSAFVGLAGGVPLPKIITNFETGVGSTLQEVGLLIALGAMLGKLLADSGGADRVIDKLLTRTSPAVLPWAMALVAIIIGIPMFFEIGLVLLLPVIVLVAQRSKLPADAHRHPGAGRPVGAARAHPAAPRPADRDRGDPRPARHHARARHPGGRADGDHLRPAAVDRSSPGWCRWAPPAFAGGVDTASAKTQHEDVRRPPCFAVTLATILFPVALMLSKALADIIANGDKQPPMAQTIFDFIGEPLVAHDARRRAGDGDLRLRGGPGRARRSPRASAPAWRPIATVILIVGAGGGFKQTLIGAGVGDSVAKFANSAHLSVLVLGYLVAVALRLATGSATVATITAAGIVAPLAGSLSPTHLALLALVIGAGSLFLSHVNDAGFWLVKESFGLTVGQTFKSWSVMETAVSLVAFGLIMALSTVV